VAQLTGRYFCDNIAPQTAEERRSDARQKGCRKLIVHVHNATPCRAKLTKSCFKSFRLRETDQPPYALDPALQTSISLANRKGKWQEANSSPERLLWRRSEGAQIPFTGGTRMSFSGMGKAIEGIPPDERTLCFVKKI
jgi:hypothetical protein